MPLNVTRSQTREEGKGPYHTEAPSCLDAVCSDCSRGMLRHQEIQSFKNAFLNPTIYMPFKGLFKPYYIFWVLAFLILLSCLFSALHFFKSWYFICVFILFNQLSLWARMSALWGKDCFMCYALLFSNPQKCRFK